jgi:glutathione S-transferase
MSKLNNLHSFTVSVARGGLGMIVTDPAARQPEQTLEFYEFEACPYCRKVREVLTAMDLPYLSRSCARGSQNRAKAVAIGGKAQFPLLVDPNTGKHLYESEEIIDYLKQTYGQGARNPAIRALSQLGTANGMLASALRHRGAQTPGRAQQPEKTLELYNFEASPYCRKVRETLHELDLDALVLNVGKKSKRRPDLVQRGGKMQVPYLIDPNTGREMYESDEIVAYLKQTYPL